MPGSPPASASYTWCHYVGPMTARSELRGAPYRTTLTEERPSPDFFMIESRPSVAIRRGIRLFFALMRVDPNPQDTRMRDLNADDRNSIPARPLGYEPPSIRALGTVAELTGSGSGQNSDASNTADQVGGSGGA
jgi:hypothetical protein